MDTSTQHATALGIVHEEAARTLSKADFDLCMRIAKRSIAATVAPAAVAPLIDAARALVVLRHSDTTADHEVIAGIDSLERALSAAPTPTVAADAAAPKNRRDVTQLADWLLTDPQTGEKLHFAGPLEPDFLRFSRVKMESKSGAVWTLSARLEEGYLTAAERLANIKRAAKESGND